MVKRTSVLPAPAALTEQLLEVEHGRLVVVSSEAEIGHHHGGQVVLLVLAQQRHTRVLTLVQVPGLRRADGSTGHHRSP